MTSILNPSFTYHNAASHGDPLKFRERMVAYAKTPAKPKQESKETYTYGWLDPRKMMADELLKEYQSLSQYNLQHKQE